MGRGASYSWAGETREGALSIVSNIQVDPNCLNIRVGLGVSVGVLYCSFSQSSVCMQIISLQGLRKEINTAI
jgi:hypothetical protein